MSVNLYQERLETWMIQNKKVKTMTNKNSESGKKPKNEKQSMKSEEKKERISVSS